MNPPSDVNLTELSQEVVALLAERLQNTKWK